MFTAAEMTGDAKVALINAAVAREYFPNEDPIGRHLGYDNRTWEIIGIVGDMRVRSLLRPATATVTVGGRRWLSIRSARGMSPPAKPSR
jgi:putative ABC transport system permease protein